MKIVNDMEFEQFCDRLEIPKELITSEVFDFSTLKCRIVVATTDLTVDEIAEMGSDWQYKPIAITVTGQETSIFYKINKDSNLESAQNMLICFFKTRSNNRVNQSSLARIPGTVNGKGEITQMAHRRECSEAIFRTGKIYAYEKNKKYN